MQIGDGIIFFFFLQNIPRWRPVDFYRSPEVQSETVKEETMSQFPGRQLDGQFTCIFNVRSNSTVTQF